MHFATTFRFYAELNDFLPPRKRQRTVIYPFIVSASVKDIIESLGVPHTEIDLILVNGQSVDFSYLVQDGDHVAVYPRFRSIDVASLSLVQPPPLQTYCFVLDVHLGRLTAYLRMLGFDALYRNDYSDETLAHIASSQQRILLTRDRGLLKRTIIMYGYCLRATNPRQQLIEVLHQFDLFDKVKPFRRCLHCNDLLKPIDKATVVDRLLSQTKQTYDDFYHCPKCDRIYWKGSHYDRMQQFIEQIMMENEG